ncbi:TetR/AcrR family transcriptional regulator [uncultured Tateyamaria sp.]|uniref:TetR/AcrR family transcriptional regulator n=1 Tax=uncultured Tateyamaria sp. TaxID=455651 RepID=UPI0026374EF9|nr:TetR/AcrR family transcriptional regulator [uncultured Tateyamaria sp.]
MNSHRLERRTKPLQTRANKTVELILETAARLLEDIGFEELTTNKICKAAGLTPPALYRYFPNKYAVVSELAKQLMHLQNMAVAETSTDIQDEGLNVGRTAVILSGQVQITRDFPGGVAVLKTMYATPQLVEVRLTSHEELADGLTSSLMELDLGLTEAELRRRVRLMIEIGNSVVEMVVENPGINEAAMIQDTAEIMHFLLTK